MSWKTWITRSSGVSPLAGLSSSLRSRCSASRSSAAESRSSLLRKLLYSVPSATPALAATSRCRTVSNPPSAARSTAPSRILFLLAFIRLNFKEHVLFPPSRRPRSDVSRRESARSRALEVRGDLLRQVFHRGLERGAEHGVDERAGGAAGVHAQRELELDALALVARAARRRQRGG